MLTMYKLYLFVLYLSIEIVCLNTLRVPKSLYNKKREQDWLEWSTNRYKISGITKNGDECIDNCVNGTCITAQDYASRTACDVIGYRTDDPVYFTTKYNRKDKFVCLTKCGKFGYDYEWCLVTKDGGWDYCSSQVYRGKYNVHLTTDRKTRCTTPCNATRNADKYLCKDSWSVSRACNPDVTVEYVPHWTIYGTICVSRCQRYGVTFDAPWSYRCSDMNSHVKNCAPPALRFGSYIREMFNRLHPTDRFTEDDVYEIPYLNTPRVHNGSYTDNGTDDWLDWSKNRYNIYGITNNGEICIDNCVDGTCITGTDIKTRKPCNVRTEVNVVYFTARYMHKDKFVCLTLCGTFGYHYEWCLVTKEGAWDYCNSEKYIDKYKVHLTTDTMSRCTTECKATIKHGDYLCMDSWNASRKCNPNVTEDYMPQRTIYGGMCVDRCRINGIDASAPFSYWCYDINKSYISCAPLAQSFGSHTREIYDRLHRIDKFPEEDIFSYQIPYY